MRIAVIMRNTDITLMIRVGLVMAESSPIFKANSLEVNLRRMRLPITVPKGWAID